MRVPFLNRSFTRALVVLCALAVPTIAQAQAPTTVQLVPPATTAINVIPISATAAVATQTTLTIPAPAGGLSNYVCTLAYQVNNDNTGTAVSNVVSTSTNFNSFAVKFSAPATASVDSGVLTVLQGAPGSGCVKSTVPGTATTFVSPAGLTHSAWSWYATYFQAP